MPPDEPTAAYRTDDYIHEAPDGTATVEWLADRPWSTGRVGMYGGSSPGQVQVLAALERPEGLAAIAPMFAPSDLHRADFFQDGAMNGQALLTWSFDAVAADTVDRHHAAGRLDDDTAAAAHDAIESATDDLLETATTRPLIDLPASVFADVALPPGLEPTDLVPHWEAWCARPTYDDFWRSFDPEPDYGRIDVPGLHVTGWYELCQSGTLANYRGLRDRSPAPQHLVVGPWTHGDTSGTAGDLTVGDEGSAELRGLGDASGLLRRLRP